METTSTAQDFLPILFTVIVALGFVVVTLIATHFLGPKRKTSDKLSTFEAGVKVVGNARQPFSIKYFLAQLQLLFIGRKLFFWIK